MMPILARKCTACATTYELLSRKVRGVEELSALDCDDIDMLHCPACGFDQYERVVHGGLGVDLGGEAGATNRYPRFDRGLGCVVKSAQHLKHLLRYHEDGTPRAIPLIQTHGDDAVDDFYEKQWSEKQRREEASKRANEQHREQHRAEYAHIDRVIAVEMEALKRGESRIFKQRTDR